MTCPGCGAPVISAQLAEDPSRVLLDPHESGGGPGRYAVWDDGKARPVYAGAQVLAYPLHQCLPPLPR